MRGRRRRPANPCKRSPQTKQTQYPKCPHVRHVYSKVQTGTPPHLLVRGLHTTCIYIPVLLVIRVRRITAYAYASVYVWWEKVYPKPPSQVYPPSGSLPTWPRELPLDRPKKGSWVPSFAVLMICAGPATLSVAWLQIFLHHLISGLIDLVKVPVAVHNRNSECSERLKFQCQLQPRNGHTPTPTLRCHRLPTSTSP